MKPQRVLCVDRLNRTEAFKVTCMDRGGNSDRGITQ